MQLSVTAPSAWCMSPSSSGRGTMFRLAWQIATTRSSSLLKRSRFIHWGFQPTSATSRKLGRAVCENESCLAVYKARQHRHADCDTVGDLLQNRAAAVGGRVVGDFGVDLEAAVHRARMQNHGMRWKRGGTGGGQSIQLAIIAADECCAGAARVPSA